MKDSFSAPGISGPSLGSVVKAPGRGGDPRRTWQAVAQLAARLAGLRGGVQSVEDALGAINQRVVPLAEMHPFKIYNLPSVLRVTPDPAADWLKFRVRAGRVLESDATATDGQDADADAETFPTTDDILVTTGTAKFWFWLEIGTGVSGETTAVVRWGDDPTVSSYAGTPAWTSTNPWTGYPKLDSAHVPIGWVDSLTNEAAKIAVVRQLVRQDLVGVGGEACPYA